jgi:hypothetical protein
LRQSKSSWHSTTAFSVLSAATSIPVRHATCAVCSTPAISEGRTQSLRISHTSRRAPLQPVSKPQLPCTPYHPPDIAGVVCSLYVYRSALARSPIRPSIRHVKCTVHIRCLYGDTVHLIAHPSSSLIIGSLSSAAGYSSRPRPGRIGARPARKACDMGRSPSSRAVSTACHDKHT